jgi:hypothetical protein
MRDLFPAYRPAPPPAPLVEPVKPVSLVEPVEPRILDLGIPGDFDAAHEGHTWKCGLVPR